MTRGEVARALKTSIASVRRLEEAGTLLPKKVEGVHQFDPAEVERVRLEREASGKVRVSPGDVEAAAIALFRQGSTAHDAVTELRIPIAQAERIFEYFKRTQPLVISEAGARELLELGFGGSETQLREANLIRAARRSREVNRQLRAQLRAVSPLGFQSSESGESTTSPLRSR